jgi:hypothetical protein
MQRISMVTGMPTMFIEAPITCSDCGHEFSAVYALIVDAQRTPELHQQLIAGVLNVVICPACGGSAVVDDLLLYHDGTAEVLIVALPEAATEAMDVESGLALLYQQMPDQVYLHHPLFVIGQPALRMLVPWVAEFARLESQPLAAIVAILSQYPATLTLVDATTTWASAWLTGGETERARKWLAIAPQLVTAGTDPHIAGEVAFRTGLLYDKLGDHAEAIAHYLAADSQFQQFDLLQRRAMCLNNLGLSYQLDFIHLMDKKGKAG